MLNLLEKVNSFSSGMMYTIILIGIDGTYYCTVYFNTLIVNKMPKKYCYRTIS